MTKTINKSFKKVFLFLALIPSIAFSQIIDVNVPIVNHDIAGNGDPTNMGEVDLSSFPNETTFPSISISSYNTVNISSQTAATNIYGALANPLYDSFSLKPSIEANYNTVNVLRDLNCNSIIGASVFGANNINCILDSKSVSTVNSVISLSNNTVNINAAINTNILSSVYLKFDPPTISSAKATWTINMNDNLLLLNNNSGLKIDSINVAYLSLYEDSSNSQYYNLISLSNNILQINSDLSGTSAIYLAFLDINGEHSIDKLKMINNKLVINVPCNAQNCSIYASATKRDSISLLPIASSADLISGNTVELNRVKDVVLGDIHNFDTFIFNLPDNLSNGDTILTLKQQNSYLEIDANKLSISNYDTGAYSSPLNLNLIDSYGFGKLVLINNPDYLYKTRSELKVIDKMLTFTFNPHISTYILDPQTKVISQGGAATLAFVCQGLDLIMDQGLFSATNAVLKANKDIFSTKKLCPFVAFSAGKNKYFTGHKQDIDVNGFSFITGLSKPLFLHDHPLTLGAFFEHGNSKFETSNFFDYDPVDDFTVAGNGNAHYNGAGLLAKLDFINNIYIDASARLGNSSSDFFTSDLTKLSNFSFDYSTIYYGAHIGSGYVYNINDNLGLDFSGKYFFTSLAGKDVSLPENQSISFDTESIQKFKFGAKLQLNDSFINTYIGLAYEYEPTNKFEATIHQKSVDTPELGGGRGIIEAGFNSNYKSLGLDLSTKYSDGNAGNSIFGMLKFSYKI